MSLFRFLLYSRVIFKKAARMNIYLFWEVRTSKITKLKNENRQNGSNTNKNTKKIDIA